MMIRNHPFFNRIFLVWSVGIICTVAVARFSWLERSPPGFHVDECASGVTIQCLAQEGIDALDNRYPLFGDCNYGSPKPPTYIYFGVLWVKIFGTSITSLRAMSVFFCCVLLGGLFCLARLLLGSRYALWVLLVSSLSPWMFQISRLALETVLAPAFLVWGIYFFLRSSRKRNALIAGVLWSLAMYSYPSLRMQAPLLILPLIWFKQKYHGIKPAFAISFVLVFVLVSLPLATAIIQGKYMNRFAEISIFSEDYLNSVNKQKTLKDLTVMFTKNYFAHFKPSFLFTRGDENKVYGARFGGILGWVDILGVFLGAGLFAFYLWQRWKKKAVVKQGQKAFLLFCVMAIGLGIAPAGLTWAGIPHSLRTIGTWPFVMLLIAYVFFRLSDKRMYLGVAVCSVATVFLGFYLWYYYFTYPKLSKGMFSAHAKYLALGSKTDDDWLRFIYVFRTQNFHLRYYLMNYKPGETCSSTQHWWKTVYPLK